MVLIQFKYHNPKGDIGMKDIILKNEKIDHIRAK